MLNNLIVNAEKRSMLKYPKINSKSIFKISILIAFYFQMMGPLGTLSAS